MGNQGINPQPAQQAQPPALQFSVGGEIVVMPLPEEKAFALRHEEFLILCDGEPPKDAERWRDVLMGALAAAAVGLIGVIASVDWSATAKNRSLLPICCALALAIGTLALLALLIFFQQRCKRPGEPSALSRLKERIHGHFESAHSSDAPESGVPSSATGTPPEA